jgi:sulfoxide reductase heme-binding subunit YedZ
MMRSFEVWRDRRGRLSVLRLATLALLATPLALAAYSFLTTGLGARPLNDLIHRTGYWALLFLLLSLAVTPFRRIARFGPLVDVRRMIGVGAFAYAAVHLTLFIADQRFDLAKVATEIAMRTYLTIGFTALLGLTALAITSTDGMVRRLGGPRWQTLHRLVYGIALLALIHFFQQTKADVWVPTFVASLFAWLMGYRLVAKVCKVRGELSPGLLVLLTVAISVLTFTGETIGISLAFNAPVFAVLRTVLDLDPEMIRPGWLALGAGLCVVALDLARGWWRKGPYSQALASARLRRTTAPA